MTPEIVSFIDKPPSLRLNRRGWFQDGFLKIYLKVGHTYYDNRFVSIVNLSTIEVVSDSDDDLEANMGKGIFTKFLDEIEMIARNTGYEALKVESVINQRLTQFLVKRGFLVIPDHAPLDLSPNLILML